MESFCSKAPGGSVRQRQDTVENGASKKPLVPQFPHSARTYKCICGLVHVKTATIVIGALSMVGFFISLFWRIIAYFRTAQHVSLFATGLSVIPLLVAIATTVTLFIGVFQQQCKFLLPFIFVQVTAVLASAVFLIIVAIFVACDTRYIIDALIDEELNSRQNHTLSKTMLISILGFQLLVNIWATRVVCTCYRYFDEFDTYQKYFSCV